jgi:hypothetical protein
MQEEYKTEIENKNKEETLLNNKIQELTKQNSTLNTITISIEEKDLIIIRN